MATDSRALTPREIVEQLDRYIVGQDKAKRAVAVALRNRWRRQQVPDELRDEIMPKNIIMIGPTGVGKTEIARRLSKLARAPFFKVEASKFTEVGYVGRDVESMVRDLVEIAINLVKSEAEERVAHRTRQAAELKILELLKPRTLERESLDERQKPQSTFVVGYDGTVESGDKPKSQVELLQERLRRGDFDDEWVEIEISDASNPIMGVLGGGNAGAFSDVNELGNVLGGMFGKQKRRRKMKVKDAIEALAKEEAHRLIDMDEITREAVQLTQQNGIIFIDEIDKVAVRDGRSGGPDVSREGVQRDLLPIVEGSSVSTKHGIVKTDHILFIAAGAFHVSKPSDLIPELQGRFPIRVELESLTKHDFRRILTEPDNSLTRQYTELLKTEDIEVVFEDDAVDAISEMAFQVNQNLENIGARRLHTIMERIFETISFDAPDLELAEPFVVTRGYVQDQLSDIMADEDLTRYIL